MRARDDASRASRDVASLRGGASTLRGAREASVRELGETMHGFETALGALAARRVADDAPSARRVVQLAAALGELRVGVGALDDELAKARA